MQDHLHPDGSMSAQLTEVFQASTLDEFWSPELSEALQCSIPDTGDI